MLMFDVYLQHQIEALAQADDMRALPPASDWAAQAPLVTDANTKQPNARHLAYRFRAIRAHYERGDLSALLTPAELERLVRLLHRIDQACRTWVSTARLVLSRVRGPHFIVTNGQLVPTLGKLLLYGLNRYVPVTHIYSSHYQPKLGLIRTIMSRLPPDCSVLVVGDGVEEREAAQTLQLPFHNVSGPQDLRELLLYDTGAPLGPPRVRSITPKLPPRKGALL